MYEPPQLGEYGENLLAIGMNGGAFAVHAVSGLLMEFSCFSDVRYYMLLSAMNRKDKRAVRVFLHDWRQMDRRPRASVSKWVPGEHFYALDKKFDTLQEALDYIREKGHQYAGIVEKHVYKD